MAALLLFTLLAVGCAVAQQQQPQLVAIVQHMPHFAAPGMRPTCDTPSGQVDYVQPGYCISYSENWGSVKYFCVQDHQRNFHAVLQTRYTDRNCQVEDPLFNNTPVWGCQQNFPVSYSFSCVDAASIVPQAFNLRSVVHYQYSSQTCSADSLNYVSGHRMGHCHLDNTNRWVMASCNAANGLQFSICSDWQCTQNCTTTTAAATTGSCSGGDQYWFTCPALPPPTPPTTNIFIETYAQGSWTCDNTQQLPWVAQYGSGNCIYNGGFGPNEFHRGMPPSAYTLECPMIGIRNYTQTYYLDPTCNWPSGFQLTNPLGCVETNPFSPQAINASCGTTAPWPQSQYYYRVQYDRTCTTPLNVEGRLFGQCYQSVMEPGVYWRHSCNDQRYLNSIISYNCTDAQCQNCIVANIEPITDYCDMFGSKIVAPSPTMCAQPVPPPPTPPQPFYLQRTFYPTQGCSAYSTYGFSFQGGKCNLAGDPFGFQQQQIPLWTTYDSGVFTHTAYGDYGCTRPVATWTENANCSQSFFDPNMSELRQYTTDPKVPYMILNSSYASTTCTGTPDLVSYIEQNVCNPIVGGGGFGNYNYIQFNCTNGQMSVAECTTHSCQGDCLPAWTSSVGCITVSTNPPRSWSLACAATPLPPPPPPVLPPQPNENLPKANNEYEQRRRTENIIIGVFSGVCGVAVIALAISGYRKMRAGGYSEL